MIRIIKALHMGFCFGVRDAIALAETQASKGPVTILGELVHNPSVLDKLRRNGIRIAKELDQVETDRLIITAHGTSDAKRKAIQLAGFEALDATCPLVRHAHTSLARLVSKGYHPVVIGKHGHIEVQGLIGDFTGCNVVENQKDIALLPDKPKFGVVAQTTQPVDRVQQLVAGIRKEFPSSEVKFEDTVCQPTKLRQEAVKDLAQSCDAVIVVGGRASNNTTELVRAARLFTPKVYHVEHAEEIRPEWLEGIRCLGITAGTSTPDTVILAVEHRIQLIARSQLDPAIGHAVAICG